MNQAAKIYKRFLKCFILKSFSVTFQWNTAVYVLFCLSGGKKGEKEKNKSRLSKGEGLNRGWVRRRKSERESERDRE